MRNISVCLLAMIALFGCVDDEPSQDHVIVSFTPASEGPGNEVRITGLGFESAQEEVIVDFNGTPARVLTVNDSLLVTEVPEGATSGPVSVEIAGVRNSSATDFTVLSGIWRRLYDIPSEVGFGAAVGFAFGGKGFVGTGGNNGRILDDFWAYDPTTDQWSELAAIPDGPRRFCSSFVIDQQAYVGLGVRDNETEISRAFYAYDLNSGIWDRIGDFSGNLPDFRDTYTSFVVGGEGYLILDKEIWKYDPTADSWTEEDVYPGAGNSTHMAEVIDGKVYIGLGFNNAFDWWGYDPSTGRWTALSPYPGAFTWSLSSFQIQDEIYVVGKECWSYDPVADRWTQHTSHPDGRRYAVGFGLGEKGYLGTGISITQDPQSFQRDFWEFDPQ
jgi:hypothetical protein